MTEEWSFKDIEVAFDQTDLNANLELWRLSEGAEKSPEKEKPKKKKKFKRTERGKKK